MHIFWSSSHEVVNPFILVHCNGLSSYAHTLVEYSIKLQISQIIQTFVCSHKSMTGERFVLYKWQSMECDFKFKDKPLKIDNDQEVYCTRLNC